MSWVNVTGDGMPVNMVQSPEYACPAGTLPAIGPTAPSPPPTQAPTAPNNCVPGYLGIATGQAPLLDDETYVNEEFGVFIIQQGDGNLVVKRGTPEASGEVVWASGGILDDAEDFYTQLNPDSNLVTYEGTPEAPGDSIWASADSASETSRGIPGEEGDYFLGIDCNSEVVSVYAGTWDNPRDGVSVWNSVPTSPPTAYPTLPPTSPPPTFALEPTEKPVDIILVRPNETATSSVTATYACMSFLTLLVVHVALVL